MSPHPPKYTHNKRNTTRLHLPDGSNGDYYCQTCQKRWFSEDTIIWAICKYFALAGYTPSPADQLKREGDIKVTGPLNIEEWIIEAKGQVPAGNEHAAFKEGMGQILMARYQRSQHILYALAMPKVRPFIQEAEMIDKKDRHYLRLHWIWVTQIQAPHHAPFEVQIDCPFGSTCECQKRIGTFCFW
jgi:hypothetical protein